MNSYRVSFFGQNSKNNWTKIFSSKKAAFAEARRYLSNEKIAVVVSQYVAENKYTEIGRNEGNGRISRRFA